MLLSLDNTSLRREQVTATTGSHTRALELPRHWPEDAAREVDGRARAHELHVGVISAAHQ